MHGGTECIERKEVAPKFRGPGGETWAGRGATPRWLKAAIKERKKLEDFAIDKTVGTAKKSEKEKEMKWRCANGCAVGYLQMLRGSLIRGDK